MHLWLLYGSALGVQAPREGRDAGSGAPACRANSPTGAIMKRQYSLTLLPTIRGEFIPERMERRVMFPPCSPEASPNGPMLILQS